MLSKSQIKYVSSLGLKKYRRQEGAFVAEGPKVVGDLLECGFRALQLYATDEWDGCGGEEVQRVTGDELRRISFLQHPQQVLAVIQLPESGGGAAASADSGLSLALDGIQDPGNLGTIIRIADWFGIGTIFCSEDTADAWSPKVVQATMGSIGRVRMVYTDLVALLSQTSLPVYGTLLNGSDIYREPLSEQGIIVMGNEGNGISAAVRPLLTRRLLIPRFHEGPESLNVAIATAITCSEFRRRVFA